MTHKLKCWPLYFNAILKGKKTFELRENDRGYGVGDVLVLEEYNIRKSAYTGRKIQVSVEYILASAIGLHQDWVVMAIKKIEKGVGCE